MAQQIINIGSAPNDGAGDPLRTAFDKCNNNFTDLYTTSGGGTGTVTSVSVNAANGVSASITNATTTPALTFSLGNIVPATVNGIALSGSSTPSLAITGATSVSGSNTGDITLAGTPDYITIAGQTITRGLIDLATDVTGDLPFTRLTPASSEGVLLGRGVGGGPGDYQQVTVGSGLTVSGTTLSADNSSPTFTGQVSLDAGSAAAPSITKTGDLNTGAFFPAADTVALATGGAERFRVTSAGSVLVNTAAIATSATDGFLYIPSCAGTPTGIPTAQTGRVPLVVDSTNNKLYFYSGGAWRDAGP